MGWTSFKSKQSFAEILVQEFSQDNYEVIEHYIKADRIKDQDAVECATGYAAIRHPKGHIFGLVVLFQRYADGEVAYKEMDDTQGPYYWDCPYSILQKLSPTTSESAIEWRNKCSKGKTLKMQL